MNLFPCYSLKTKLTSQKIFERLQENIKKRKFFSSGEDGFEGTVNHNGFSINVINPRMSSSDIRVIGKIVTTQSGNIVHVKIMPRMFLFITMGFVFSLGSMISIVTYSFMPIAVLVIAFTVKFIARTGPHARHGFKSHFEESKLFLMDLLEAEELL